MSTLREEIREISGDHEVLTAELVSTILSVSQRDANNALAALARSGDLTRIARGKYASKKGVVLSVLHGMSEDVAEGDIEEAIRKGGEAVARGRAALGVTDDDDYFPTADEVMEQFWETFSNWLAEQFDLDPRRVAIAVAYFNEFPEIVLPETASAVGE